MPKQTRRDTFKTVAALLTTGAIGTAATGTAEAAHEGRGIEQEGATLNRFATTATGAEITGLFVTDDGEFFFNVQHPDPNNMWYGMNKSAVGHVDGFDINDLPRDFESVQVPESPRRKQDVQTARGEYGVLAIGGQKTKNGEPLGAAVSPDGEVLTSSTNPDFNGVIDDGDDGYYVFTNWENRPGMVSRTQIKPDGNGGFDTVERMNVDFRDVEGTWVNCFGSVSPWGTPLSAEENYEHTAREDWNNPEWDSASDVETLAEYLGADGNYEEVFPNPYRYGYIVEFVDAKSESPTPVKQFTLGRSAHEVAEVMPDEKTVYTSSDGTGKGFYKFVADDAGDLSSGTLYAAKADADAGTDPNSVGFDLEWVELGSASNEEIESWIAEYDDVTRADYTPGENSYITDEEIEAWAAGDADDDRVAFLETREAALAKGATMEFRKMEGISRKPDADPGDYLYMAMSAVAETMADEEGEIQLEGNDYGAIYRMRMDYRYDVSRMEPIVTGGEDANICGGCPYDANPNSNSKACQSCSFNPANEDSEDGGVSGMANMASSMAKTGMTSLDTENTIANPDNIRVIDDGRLIIGEDTGHHDQNMIWVFDAGDA